MLFLKQSTATTVIIGPFLDDTDGKTAETGLTISQADVRVSKNGAVFGTKSEASGATHDEKGWYRVPLNTTDTGTLGSLIIMVHESGALPVWTEYMVLPANIYDSIVSGSDYIKTDVTEISSDSTAADNLESYCDGGDNIPTEVMEYNAAADFNATQKGSIGTAVADETVEGALDIAEVLQVLLAFAAGKCDGGGTTTIHFRDQADTKNRITLTVDTDGDRSATVLSVD